MRYLLFLAFSLFLFSKSASATHIVGGEMTYRCLGNLQVEISLTVFRDCYTGVPAFDNPALIAMYDENWDTLGYFTPSPIGNDTLPIILTNPCLSIPPNVCVHRTTYKQIITLPSANIGYKFAYQRCCRNQLIRNIQSPLATGATFMIEITPEAIQACNNSPVFRQWPPVAICVNQPIDFDHGAFDVDGDSIAYELCTPLVGGDSINNPVYSLFNLPPPGPYDEVSWVTPLYDLNNVLGGDPLTIDPETGFLKGTPNTIGNFVVGICAKEYRNGVLISTLRRDFQYNVSDCGEPVAAFQSPIVQCDDLTVKFDNTSLFVDSGYKWFFDFNNNPDAQSTFFEPAYAYPDTGTYLTALIVNPGMACTDTAFQWVMLTNGHISADFDLAFPDCDSTLTISVTDASTDSLFDVVSWAWVLGGPNGYADQSTLQNPIFEVSAPGVYKLTLTATSANGCTRTLTKPFQSSVPSIAGIEELIRICTGDTIALFPGANPDYNYVWSINVGTNQITNPNPFVSPEEMQMYTVEITNPNNGCKNTANITVEIGNSGGVLAQASADPEIIVLGQSSQLFVEENSTSGPFEYEWSPSNSLDFSDIQDPLASPTDSTWYFVTITESTGCSSTASILVQVIKDAVCAEPYLFIPTGFSPNGDNLNDVLLVEGNFIEELHWIIYDRWGKKVFESNQQTVGWDGTLNGLALPPDVYGYHLVVRCPGGFETIRKGNVNLLR